jgi:hypothetical protein
MKKIYVKIDEENFEKLKEKKGFMQRQAYPDFHEKDAPTNEIGSFLDFRFLKS